MENGKLIADSVRVQFHATDGSLILDADLVDLQIGIYEVSEGKQSQYQCYQPFAAWIQKHMGIVLSTSQASAVYHHVLSEYEQFEKKFNRGSKSVTVSVSTPEALTVEPVSSLAGSLDG